MASLRAWCPPVFGMMLACAGLTDEPSSGLDDDLWVRDDLLGGDESLVRTALGAPTDVVRPDRGGALDFQGGTLVRYDVIELFGASRWERGQGPSAPDYEAVYLRGGVVVAVERIFESDPVRAAHRFGALPEGLRTASFRREPATLAGRAGAQLGWETGGRRIRAVVLAPRGAADGGTVTDAWEVASLRVTTES